MNCGLCSDVCPKRSITIRRTKHSIYPEVDHELCTDCGLCQKVCAGKGIEIGNLSKQLYASDSTYDKYLGYYHTCFSGYSLDKDNQLHAASGGCLTSFLRYLLDKNYITGAVVVGFEKENPTTTCAFIAHTSKEITESRGSKYAVVSFEGIISQILEEKGQYVVVGLPCLIQGFRKYEQTIKKLSQYIFGYFSIYCSSTRTTNVADYLMYRYKVNKEDVKRFEYRGNGCLGYMTFYGDGSEMLRQVPYEHYWQGMRGFFNNARCSLCIDHYGELADVSFGDIHIREYINNKIGINSLFSRNAKWTSLLNDAARAGYMELQTISPQIIRDSQGYAMRQKKGNGVANAIKLRSLMNEKNPAYDVQLIGHSSTKGLLKEIMKVLMRWIGRHRCMWWIVKTLDSK